MRTGCQEIIHVGDELVDNAARRELVAGVVAHEIAHNLALEHVSNDTDNLMYSPGLDRTGTELTQAQIAQALGSRFSI